MVEGNGETVKPQVVSYEFRTGPLHSSAEDHFPKHC